MKPLERPKHATPLPKPQKRRSFLKLHVTVLASLAVTLGLVSVWPSEQAGASRQIVAVALPTMPEPAETELQKLVTLHEEEPDSAVDVEVYVEDEPPTEQLASIETTVKPGDSLSVIFKRAGLSDRAMYEVLNCCDESKKLARLYPGHKFVFWLDADKTLVSLEHVLDRLERQVFARADNGFAYERHSRTPDTQVALRSSTITTSLYHAGVQSEIEDGLIMQLASIFGWDIDFALDIRKGDSFKIVFEERYLDGERIGTGNILAAEFVNQSRTHRAVRYVDSEGHANYYTPDGEAMRKAFLRAPLDFRRISSNFNPRRLHPIHKTVRPHRGTDYAADRGTPIWASGDGRVIGSGFSKANGNYIVIQHGSDIQTKYLHLDKRHVKQGDRVRQKQVIGTVGSTGYSTAPHLHYEFLVNGVHRDPRTIVEKLPMVNSVAKAELPNFFAQTRVHLAELEKSDTQMASAGSL